MPLLVIVLFLIINVKCATAQQVDAQPSFIADAKYHLHEDSYEIMLAGEQEVLVITQQGKRPITRGVAVLLNESGRHPVAQNGLAPLASHLNEYGWVTMLMGAPGTGFSAENPSSASIEEGATSAGNTPDAEKTKESPLHAFPVLTEANFARHEQAVKVQLQSIRQRAQSYPGFFLVIAQGTSAAWATKIYSEQQLPAPDALVVISPFWPQRNYNKQLASIMASTEMPVLDIYTLQDLTWSMQSAPERRNLAEKELKVIYRQRHFASQIKTAPDYAALSKVIYGWLLHIGW